MLNLSSIDFMNSDWQDWHRSSQYEDRLLNPTWRKWFLDKWGFGAQAAPSDNVLQEMKQLRVLLHEVIHIEAQGGLSESVLSNLNVYLERVPLIRRVIYVGGKPTLTLVPVETGWSEVMAGVVASLIDLLNEYPGRVKCCASSDCRWVFFDESRNRTRRWCANICGNLMKVRRFRARRQGQQD